MPKNWIRNLFTQVPTNRKARRAGQVRRLQGLEVLEDRTVPAFSPSVSFSGAAIVTTEGTFLSRNGFVQDGEFPYVPPGDVITMTTSLGAISPNAPFNYSGTPTPITWTYTPPNGLSPAVTTPVSVSATDLDGTTTVTFNLTVNNVAPSLTASSSQVAVAGKSMGFNLGTFNDPGLEPNWTVGIDWDNNGTFEDSLVTTSKGTVYKPFTFAAAGSYPVNVQVSDPDGGVSPTRTFNVAVVADLSTTYVSNSISWTIGTDIAPVGLSAGDTVSNGSAVNKIFGYDAWSTIDDARQVTTAAGTINVLAGTTDAGNVTFAKAVTVTRLDAGTASVTGSLTATGSGVTFSNLTITGGVAASASGLTLTNNVISAPGTAVALNSGATGASLTGNTVSGTAGVVLSGTASATISSGSNTASSGVVNQGSGSLSITGGTIGSGIIGVEQSGSGSTTISGGTIQSNIIGLFVNSGTATVSGASTSLSGNTTGIKLETGGTLDLSAAVATAATISGGTNSFAASGGTLSGSTLGGLKFTGSPTNYITLTAGGLGGSTIDATGVTFDTEFGSALTRVSSPSGFAVENKISHFLDAAATGFVRTTSNRVFVTNGGSIQRAIDKSAASGDTVFVDAGTFAEDLTVNKGVSLRGPNDALSPNSGTRLSPGVAEAVLNGSGIAFNVTGAPVGSTILVAGFKLTGSGSTLLQQGSGSGGTTLTFEKNWAVGRGQMYVDDQKSGGGTTTLTVDDNRFINSGSNAMQLIGTPLTNNFLNATVTGNVIDGASNAGLNSDGLTDSLISGNTFTNTAQQGVQVAGRAAAVIVQNNTFTDVNTSADTTRGAIRVSSAVLTGAVTISGNTISGNAVTGIFVNGSANLSGGSLSISGNTISDQTSAGIRHFGLGTVSVSGGTITVPGTANGMLVSGLAATLTVTGGTITGTGAFTGLFVTSGVLNVSGGTITGALPTIDSTGIVVIGGTANMTGGIIKATTTGINFTGGTATVSGVDFDDATDNTTDVRIATTGLTIGAANQFAGDTFYIDNLGTQSYDLSALTGITFDESNNFRIEDKMHHRVDTDLLVTNGLVTWVAGNVYVTQPGVGSTDSSVQRGVDSASSGNTVNIEGGTAAYNETSLQSATVAGYSPGQVKVTKALTLLGVNVLGVSPLLIGGVVSASPGYALIDIAASGVTLDNLRLDVTRNTGAVAGVTSYDSANQNNLSIQGLTIRTSGTPNGALLLDPAILSLGSSTGITIVNTTATPNSVTINNSSVLPDIAATKFLLRALQLIGNASTVTNNILVGTGQDLQLVNAATSTISGNQITAAGATIIGGGAGSVVTLSGNTFTQISGFGVFPTTSLTIRDVNTTPNGATVVVNANNFVDIQSSRPAIISGASNGITVTNNTFTPVVGATNYTYVLVNSGYNTGGTPAANTANGITIQGNAFNGSASTTGRAIEFQDSNSVGSGWGTIVVGGAGALANSFAANLNEFIRLSPAVITTPTVTAVGMVSAAFSTDLDATGNNFDVGAGLQTPAAMNLAGKFVLEQKLTHKPDSTALGLITVVPNFIYVPSTQTIQGGIDAVPNGSTGWTVRVDAGTYAETLNVNEDVTLLGAGKSTTTIQPLTAGLNNAVVTVSAAGVTIDGFTIAVIQPTNIRGIYAAGNSATSWTNLLVQNNTIISAGTPSSASRGIFTQDAGPSYNGSITVRANDITAAVGSAFWRGVETIDTKFTTIGGSLLSDGNTIGKTAVLDVRLGFPAAGGTSLVRNNTFTGGGLEVTTPNGGSASIIQNNSFAPAVNGYRQALFVNNNTAAGATVSVLDNAFTVRGQGETVTRPGVGVFVGGSGGVTVSNNVFNAVTGATNFVHTLLDTQFREGSDGIQSGDDVPDTLVFQGNVLNGSGTPGGVGLAFYNGNSTRVVTGTVTGSQYGVNTIGGAGALANSFAGGLGTFIQLNSTRNPIFPNNVGPTVPGAVNLDLDATGNNFDVGGGLQTPAAMNLAGKFVLEQKLTHKPDSTALGLITVVPNNVYVPAVTNTIQKGIDAVPNGSTGWTVNVQAGTFNENLLVDEDVTLSGANSSISASSGATRNPETILVTVGAAASRIIDVTKSNVSILGFTLDGRDINFAANKILSSGAEANAAHAVRNTGAISGLVLQNNIVQNVEVGARLDSSDGGSMSLIDNNWMRDIGRYDYGYAVTLRNNFYADITNNKMSQVHSGLLTLNFSTAGPNANWNFSNNLLSVYAAGVWTNSGYSDATGLTIDNNTFSVLSAAITAPDKAQFDGKAIGILATTLQNATSLTITNNSITGMPYGIVLYNTESTTPIVIGNTNTITGNGVGIYLTNIVGFNPVTSTVLGGVPPGPPAPNNPTGTAKATLSGLTLTGNTTGVLVRGSNPDSAFGVELTLTGTNTITGGTTGLTLDGAAAKVVGNTLGSTVFTGQSSNYLVLANGAYNAAANSGNVLDAGSAIFNGVTGGMATLSQAYAIEDKITHQLDNATLGFVQLQTNKAFVTQLSNGIQRGISAEGIATNGKVYVQAGTYDEDIAMAVSSSDLIGLQLLGAGAGSTTIRGVVGGPGLTVTIGTNQILDGFTITRVDPAGTAGENTIALSNVSGATGFIVSNNVFTQNRTAIYATASGQGTLTRNVIDNNRTGILFTESNNGAYSITENVISNNRTFGILFTPGAVVIDPGLVITNNSITGNFAVQLENNSGNPVNAAGNWFGTTNLTTYNGSLNSDKLAANLDGNGNPFVWAYPGPISAPAAPMPYSISGTSLALTDVSPFLWTGTDTNLVANGFQGDFTQLGVTTTGGQIQAGGRINEAIGYNANSATTVNVLAGTYAEALNIGRAVTVRAQGNSTVNSLEGVSAGQLDVNAKTFTYGDANDLIFNGAFVGTGSIVKQGSGRSTLTGNSSAFAGTTAVNVGTIELTGQLGGAVNVNTSGTLSGTGTVGGLLTNGGTVSPGTNGGVNIGTLTAAGYTQSVAGKLQVTAASASSFDQLVVSTGAVSLAGTLEVNYGTYEPLEFAPFPFLVKTSAGAISGTFGTFLSLNSPLGYLAPVLTLTINGNANPFLVAYGSGDGNDFALVKLPGALPLSQTFVDDNWAAAAQGTKFTINPTGLANIDVYIGFSAYGKVQDALGFTTATGTVSIYSGTYNADSIDFGSKAQQVQLVTGESATINGKLAGTNPSAKVALNRGSLSIGDATNSSFAGTISGLTNRTGFVKIGGGELTLLNTANDYNGATTVAAGKLTVGTDEVLPNSTAVTVSSGATLHLNGKWETIGSLAGAGTVTFGSGGQLTSGGAGRSTTFSGAITGTGDLIKEGAGTLTLSGNGNTYTGTTYVDAGTLQIGAGGTTGKINSNVVLEAGAALAFNRSSSGTQSAWLGTGKTITGDGSVIKNGSGDLTLDTAGNSYTGGTVVNAGGLVIADTTSEAGLGAGSVTVNGTSKVKVTGNTTTARTFDLATGASIVVSASKTLTLDGAAINGGRLSGPGTTTTTTSGTTFTGVTIANGAIVTLGGNSTFETVVNSGKLTIPTGITATLNDFINSASGLFFVYGLANVDGYTTNGYVEISRQDPLSGPAGKLDNLGFSPIIVGGGGTINIGYRTTTAGTGPIPSTGGSQAVRTSRGQLFLTNSGIVMQSGSVLRNNGFIEANEVFDGFGDPVPQVIYLNAGSTYFFGDSNSSNRLNIDITAAGGLSKSGF